MATRLDQGLTVRDGAPQTTPGRSVVQDHSTSPLNVIHGVHPKGHFVNLLSVWSSLSTLFILLSLLFPYIEVVGANFIYQGIFLITFSAGSLLVLAFWLGFLVWHMRKALHPQTTTDGQVTYKNSLPYSWHHRWDLWLHWIAALFAVMIAVAALWSWQQRHSIDVSDRYDVGAAPASPASIRWIAACQVAQSGAVPLFFFWIIALTRHWFAESEFYFKPSKSS